MQNNDLFVIILFRFSVKGYACPFPVGCFSGCSVSGCWTVSLCRGGGVATTSLLMERKHTSLVGHGDVRPALTIEIGHGHLRADAARPRSHGRSRATWAHPVRRLMSG